MRCRWHASCATLLVTITAFHSKISFSGHRMSNSKGTIHYYISDINSTVITYHILIRGMPAGGWCIGCAYAKFVRAKPFFPNREEETTYVPHIRTQGTTTEHAEIYSYPTISQLVSVRSCANENDLHAACTHLYASRILLNGTVCTVCIVYMPSCSQLRTCIR